MAHLAAGAIFFGSFVYSLERLEMGEEAAAFPDIGNAAWFMLVTFSTVGYGHGPNPDPNPDPDPDPNPNPDSDPNQVGYGDVSPNSHSGKVVTSIAIMVGVVFMAMPLQIVRSNL